MEDGATVFKYLSVLSPYMEPDLPKEEERRNPLWAIAALLGALILILSLIPLYGIPKNPEPRNIPSLEEIPLQDNEGEAFFDNPSRGRYPGYVSPDVEIKRVADFIVTESCPEAIKTCYAKALYYFVRDELQYVNDPTAYEYVKTPKEALTTRGGDCDDAAVLLANLLEAVGIETRFVFIPGHVYIQAWLPDMPGLFKEAGWTSLDPTCADCGFGDVPYSDRIDRTFI